MHRLIPCLATVAFAGVLSAPAAVAGWSLDPERSQVAFVSIKAGDIGEAHNFQEIAGRIDDAGQAEVEVMLDSVETLIPIRNERMREMLFKTARYDKATLTAKIDPAQIDAMQPGDVAAVVAESTLSLHGESQPLTLEMQVAKLDANTLMAASTKPVILDANNFGLGDGVDKLREIAGLESISDAVPVTFVMTFENAQPAAGEGAASTGAGAQPETLAAYEQYRAIIEAMSPAQKEAIAALFGSQR